MKRFLTTTALIAAMAGPAFAEAHSDGMTFRAEAGQNDLLASDFIGMRVYTSEAAVEGDEIAGVQDNWNDIGEINDIVLSRDGSVEAVLLDIGGFLGIGERQVALDMDAIRFVSDSETAEDASDFFLVVNAAQADLEQAPEFTWTTDPSMATETTAEADATVTEDTEVAADQSDATMADDTEVAANTEATTETEVVPGTDMASDETPMRDPVMREGCTTAERDALTTEELTGAPVYDANDEWIGEVSELLVTDAGTLNEAVVDVGGFLGIGEKPVALSMDNIDILRADDGSEVRVYVPMTKEELEAMPDYEG